MVGKGRALLEGMACARAAYLYDVAGSDGWVTPERYGAMEADGFAGQAFATTPSGAALPPWAPARSCGNRWARVRWWSGCRLAR